jgi:hypothetical protein
MFLHGKGKTTRQTRAYKMGEKTPLPAEKWLTSEIYKNSKD